MRTNSPKTLYARVLTYQLDFDTYSLWLVPVDFHLSIFYFIVELRLNSSVIKCDYTLVSWICNLISELLVLQNSAYCTSRRLERASGVGVRRVQHRFADFFSDFVSLLVCNLQLSIGGRTWFWRLFYERWAVSVCVCAHLCVCVTLTLTLTFTLTLTLWSKGTHKTRICPQLCGCFVIADDHVTASPLHGSGISTSGDYLIAIHSGVLTL